jgi:hypothetical protein
LPSLPVDYAIAEAFTIGVSDGAVGAPSLLDWKIDMATSLSSDYPLGSQIGEVSTDTPFIEADGITPSMEWTSTFASDTWVFFAQARSERAQASEWGLGFGPIRHDLPRWSLFHCVAEDRFDARVVCAHFYPSSPDLFRWSRSIVGPAVSGDLLESVGSCVAFYRQYFADRKGNGPICEGLAVRRCMAQKEPWSNGVIVKGVVNAAPMVQMKSTK